MFWQDSKGKKKRSARQELIRRNIVCLFEDGISKEQFEAIASRECMRFESVLLEAEVDGPVIQGIVCSQSRTSEAKFKIDFNNFGHITGKYWMWSDNDNTEIPEMIAESISEAFRNYQSSPHYERLETDEGDETRYENSTENHISFCPYCGSKQYIINPNFCSVCGMKLSSTEEYFTQLNETADFSNRYSHIFSNKFSYGEEPTAGSGFTNGAESTTWTTFTCGPGAAAGFSAGRNKAEKPSETNTSNAKMLPRIAVEVTCNSCDASTVVRTYRKFVRCPYCSSNIVFPGFSYKKIDHGSEKYSSVQYWMSCPSCRGDNMCLWTSSDRWICQDCGYSFSELQRLKGVFWFCDCCETYMNVQPGFKNRGETWKCTECGFENCVM